MRTVQHGIQTTRLLVKVMVYLAQVQRRPMTQTVQTRFLFQFSNIRLRRYIKIMNSSTIYKFAEL